MNDFSNVLFIGPEDKNGGIGSVIRTYAKMSDIFHYIPTHSTSVYSKHLYFVSSFFKIAYFLFFHKEIRIIHLHAASNGSFIRKSIILNLAKMFRRKVILHLHGGGFFYFYKRNIFLSRFILSILNQSDLIFCLSADWKKRLNELPIRSTVLILNNPVVCLSGIRSKYFGYQLKLLFIGNIIPTKGIFKFMDYLLSSPFFQQGRISLTIAGLGQVDVLGKYLSNPTCQDQITYLGWIDDEIKFKQLFSNHILILPSSFEGLPVSILESFSSGMPVIATRVGGIPDIVFPGINGWLFDSDNFTELDSIFQEIFNNPELVDRYGSGTLDVVRPFFSDNVKETLLKYYSSLI